MRYCNKSELEIGGDISISLESAPLNDTFQAAGCKWAWSLTSSHHSPPLQAVLLALQKGGVQGERIHSDSSAAMARPRSTLVPGREREPIVSSYRVGGVQPPRLQRAAARLASFPGHVIRGTKYVAWERDYWQARLCGSTVHTHWLVGSLGGVSRQLLQEEHEQAAPLLHAGVEEGLVADLPLVAQVLGGRGKRESAVGKAG